MFAFFAGRLDAYSDEACWLSAFAEFRFSVISGDAR